MGVPEIGKTTAVFGKRRIVATCPTLLAIPPDQLIKYITVVFSEMVAVSVGIAPECVINKSRRRFESGSSVINRNMRRSNTDTQLLT